MKDIKQILFEKLHLDTGIKINNSEAELDYELPPFMNNTLPDVDSRVLVVTAGKKTSRESYVTYDVMEILGYSGDKVLLRPIDSNDKVGVEFKITSKEDYNKLQVHTKADMYFAKFQKNGFQWSKVFDIENGTNLLSYGITSLNRKLHYIFHGFRLDYKGNKINYLKKLSRLLNAK